MAEVGKAIEADKADGVPIVGGTPTSAVPPEVMQAGSEILQNLVKWYIEESKKYPMDPVLVSKLMGTCLMQYAAILAVDTGVLEEQFLQSAQILYAAAYKAAPKFG